MKTVPSNERIKHVHRLRSCCLLMHVKATDIYLRHTGAQELVTNP